MTDKVSDATSVWDQRYEGSRLIVLTKRMLTESGIVPNYQTAIVARRRPVPLSKLTEAEAERINYAGWTLPEPPAAKPGLVKRLFGG